MKVDLNKLVKCYPCIEPGQLIYFLQNVIIMNVFSVSLTLFAVVAQLAEHTLGKGEVTGPIPVNGST